MLLPRGKGYIPFVNVVNVFAEMASLITIIIISCSHRRLVAVERN